MFFLRFNIGFLLDIRVTYYTSWKSVLTVYFNIDDNKIRNFDHTIDKYVSGITCVDSICGDLKLK